MFAIVHLAPGQEPPDEECWIMVERDPAGQFHGSGMGRKHNGRPVLYMPPNDIGESLETALDAAMRWGEGRGVRHIYVQMYA